MFDIQGMNEAVQELITLKLSRKYLEIIARRVYSLYGTLKHARNDHVNK